MESGWLLLALAFALADWTAVGRGWRRVRLITKPGVLLALLAGFTTAGGWQPGLLWFGLGLVASLAGDVFLLFPRRWFVAGLASFLAAHLAYLGGFQPQTCPVTAAAIAVPFAVAVPAALIFPTIIVGLRRAGRRRLCYPFYAYALAISLMLVSALLTLLRPDWPLQAAGLAATGAGLFFLSDAILATHRFAHRLPHADLAIMVAYHVGQFALISSALLRYQR